MKKNKILSGLFLSLIWFSLTPILPAQIAISELNYHSDSLNSSGDWIELHNYSNTSVNITGWTLKDGNPLNPAYAFPNNSIIPAGGYLVLGENAAKFSSIYSGMTLDGILPFEFSNRSEEITLRNASNMVQIQFTYGDSTPWSKCADGLGRTLQIINEQANANDPNNWGCGCVLGSPKAARTACINEKIVVAEINYNSLLSDDPGDWIELRNTSNGGINISGWKLTDKNYINSFTFPTGTILNPFARIVVYADNAKFSSIHPTVLNKIGPISFGFSADGDAIKLYDATNKVHFVTYYNDNINWPQGPDGHGLTLELDTNFTNLDDACSPDSWFGGCYLGSPGKAFMMCADFSNSEAENASIDIFPNPTTDIIHISKANSIKIFNINGALIQTFTPEVNENISLTLEHLVTGIYTLQVEINSKKYIQKIIKL